MAPKSSEVASREYFSEKEYGVSASPRVVAMGNEVPQGGGRYQVGEPYKVNGKTYKPKEDPNYTKVGLASWYGHAFHGRETANGEIYDMGELTAAHPTLPLPSYVRVTNLANNRSVVVRVNDRGPFKKGRIIDVSATVAEMLDFKRAGTAKVKVEYVGRARPDGRDRQMLLASYQGPNDFGGNSLFAGRATSKPNKLAVASLGLLRWNGKGQPDRSLDLFGAQRLDSPPVTTPAYAPAAMAPNDSLGPLILRTGFLSSYAPTDHFSRAHRAATALAQGGRTTAVIQIGTYSDKANADRVAKAFADYGNVVTTPTAASDRTLFIVRVMADGANQAPDRVLSVAQAIGIPDAFVVSR
jgi:peptidoglycan lytic transglycosylase